MKYTLFILTTALFLSTSNSFSQSTEAFFNTADTFFKTYVFNGKIDYKSIEKNPEQLN
ncbi:MAG TPA: DUF547 domain-containing protein, partial [Flavobacteriaceae bacterium]|nr:DUF547 domain-containing protein [Flavobacteriaceae bacterium]